MSAPSGLVLRSMQAADVDVLHARYGGPPLSRPIERWRHMLEQQERGDRVVVIADLEPEGRRTAQRAVGYCSLRWESSYPPFREAATPVLLDLWVDAAWRRRGIGTAIISHLEQRVRQAGIRQVGIAVGLYDGYGPAQRRYVRLGYVPDGRGATANDRPVTGGETLRIDDGFVLWLTKDL